MSPRGSSRLLLTQRALQDVQAIFDYSAERWGKPTADKYLDDLEAGLERLRAHPELLKPEPDFHPALRFYRVHRHLIVCDVRPGTTVVLTVVHTSQDIPTRLAELQPTLSAEVELLHRKLQTKRAGRKEG